MRKAVARWKRDDGTIGKNVAFICNNYNSGGKTACTTHKVHEDALIQLVSDEIREYAKMAVYDEKRVVEAVIMAKDRENLVYLETYQRELKTTEERLRKLDGVIATLYEDKVNGVVTEAIFKGLMTKYEAERKEKSKATAVLKSKVSKCQKDRHDTDAWLRTIRKYTELETLTADVLLELIDTIEIFESEKIGKQKICKIRIHYRFVGDISGAFTGLSDETTAKEAESYGLAV
jgi:hypothetical protein